MSSVSLSPTTATATATATASGGATRPDADDDATAARLRFVITRLHRRLRQHAAGDLTLTQASTLVTVRKDGPLTLGDLATTEQVSRPTITNVVDKLEAKGLVERTIDAHDRRVCRVSVTPAGEQRLAEIRDQRTAWLHDRLDRFDPAERARIDDALLLLEHLATDPGAPA